MSDTALNPLVSFDTGKESVMSSIAERRATVIAAYEAACLDPANADWQALAHEMRATMPATTRKASQDADSPYAPWVERDHDSLAKKAGQITTWFVVFACGRAVRLSMWQSIKHASNVGKALRIAFAFYRARVRRQMTGGALNGIPYYQGFYETWAECIDVPCVTRIECETTQERFDANDASERTVDARRGSFNALRAIAIADACDNPSEALALMWRHAVLTAIAPSFPKRDDIDAWTGCLAAKLPHAWLTVPAGGNHDGAATIVAEPVATAEIGAPMPIEAPISAAVPLRASIDALMAEYAAKRDAWQASETPTPETASEVRKPMRLSSAAASRIRSRLLSGAVGICAEKLHPLPKGNWHPSREAIGTPIPRQLAAALAKASFTPRLVA